MPTFDEIRKQAEERATGRTVIPHRTPAPTSLVPTRKAGFYLVDGIQYPSVTTILKVIDKPALIRWAAKMGAKAVLTDPMKYDTPEAAAGAIYDMSGNAADRGTAAHKVAENYARAIVKGTADSFDSEDPYFPAVKSFFETMKPEVHFIEAILVNTKDMYAGTADLIAKIGKRTFIVDWKTSKFVYDEYPLQVEAYRRSDMLIDSATGERVTEQTQMADAGGIVLLRDNGSFQWTETKGDFEAFIAARRIWLWKESLAGD